MPDYPELKPFEDPRMPDRIRGKIRERYKCDSRHLNSLRFEESLDGHRIWLESVETFALVGHHQIQICYCWSRPTGAKIEEERIILMPQQPPIESPRDAVRMFFEMETRTRQSASEPNVNFDRKYRAVAYTHDGIRKGNAECDLFFDDKGYPYGTIRVVGGGKAIELTPLIPDLLKRSPVPDYDFSYIGTICLADPRN